MQYQQEFVHQMQLEDGQHYAEEELLLHGYSHVYLQKKVPKKIKIMFVININKNK